MENEAYLDELDRELAEYNRERTGAKLKPAEKDGGFETARYGYQLEAVEQGITKLSTFAEVFEKDIVAIDERRNRDFLAVVGNAVCFVASGAGSIVFAFLALKMGVGGVVSFFFLCAICVAGAAFFGLRTLNNLTSYLIKERSNPHDVLVEQNYIRSYKGEREFYFDCIGDLHGRISELRRLKDKIEKDGFITDKELERARHLGEYREPPCIYKMETYSFRDWIVFRAATRKAK
ncbi:MAG: hypothetical protein J5643_10860 [Lachnospiraceae bacterium]|nr:hypothetical protein [Lachnospiraceae bacterium]